MFYRIWPKNSRIGSIILAKSNNKKLARNHDTQSLLSKWNCWIWYDWIWSK